MDTATPTSLNLSLKTKEYINRMRKEYGFTLSYMINLVCMEHAYDRKHYYNVKPPNPMGRPRVHPEKQEKKQWVQSYPVVPEAYVADTEDDDEELTDAEKYYGKGNK